MAVNTVVTDRSSLTDTTQIQTVLLPAWRIILTRTLRVYLQSLLGMLSAAGLGAIPTGSQTDAWHMIYHMLGLALFPAAFSFLQNSLELLNRLDETRPALRG